MNLKYLMKRINVVLTDVGDKYVLEEINKHGYSIGGENSGHIILRDYINTGDGLLASLILLKILTDTEKTLYELTKDIKMWPQELVNIRTFNKDILLDERVVQVVDEVKNILKDNGKVLVRASGTEPLVRVTLSCETQIELDKHMDKISIFIYTDRKIPTNNNTILSSNNKSIMLSYLDYESFDDITPIIVSKLVDVV